MIEYNLDTSIASRLAVIRNAPTFAEAARTLGLTRERVRQIANEAGISSPREWGTVARRVAMKIAARQRKAEEMATLILRVENGESSLHVAKGDRNFAERICRACRAAGIHQKPGPKKGFTKRA